MSTHSIFSRVPNRFHLSHRHSTLPLFSLLLTPLVFLIFLSVIRSFNHFVLQSFSAMDAVSSSQSGIKERLRSDNEKKRKYDMDPLQAIMILSKKFDDEHDVPDEEGMRKQRRIEQELYQLISSGLKVHDDSPVVFEDDVGVNAPVADSVSDVNKMLLEMLFGPDEDEDEDEPEFDRVVRELYDILERPKPLT